MKAVVQHTYGSPDVLRFADVETPSPGPGEVLVRTRAASVNARDWHLLRGDPYLARLLAPELGLRAPRNPIPGTDFAGTVDAVGAGVTGVRPGDEVFGEAPGAFAEYVLAPEDHVVGKPANLTFEQAAALPTAANTALTCLRDADVRAGQSVLINGASGGVGTFATRLATEFGADVTGVCSPRNAELVRSLGARRVVDYTREDFVREDHRYDVVLDLVGNRSLRALRHVLTPDGTLVLSGGGVSTGGSLVGPMGLLIRGQATARFVRHRILVPTATPSRANLTTLRELAERGQLTPILDRTYPLAAAADAIGYLETDHARAKVVLAA